MSNIDKICKKYGIQNYTINEDGSIDVDGDVDLRNKGLTKLPLKFRRVTGTFTCSRNRRLRTLEGIPSCLGGMFFCDNIQKLWNASSDVFKVLHARDKWVVDYRLWNL